MYSCREDLRYTSAENFNRYGDLGLVLLTRCKILLDYCISSSKQMFRGVIPLDDDMRGRLRGHIFRLNFLADIIERLLDEGEVEDMDLVEDNVIAARFWKEQALRFSYDALTVSVNWLRLKYKNDAIGLKSLLGDYYTPFGRVRAVTEPERTL